MSGSTTLPHRPDSDPDAAGAGLPRRRSVLLGIASALGLASAAGVAQAGQSITRVNATRVPATLRPLARAVYSSRTVNATPAAAAALGRRRLPRGTVRVAGSTGTWKGTGVGVLTYGHDVTLAVHTSAGWRVVGGWWPSMKVSGHVLGGKRFILFIGSDAREKKGEHILKTRGDTLQVVGIDGHSGGGIMGMARDLYVDIPGHAKNKINAALAYGGPALQTRTVAQATGLPIQGYVITGFEGFIKIIDQLGGLPITVPRRVKTIPAGRRRFTGHMALVYARERHSLPNGDFDRSANQSRMLFALGALAKRRGPRSLPRMLTIASRHVVSDLSAAEALLAGAWVYQARLSRWGARVAKGPFGRTKSGKSIVILGAEAKAVFRDFRDGNLSR